MTARSAAASQAQPRKAKLNAVWISSGRRYAANRSGVGQPHLADQRPRLGVAVGDAPATPGRRRAPRPGRIRVRERRVGRVEVGQRGVLHQQRGRVDADAVGAAVEPEPQHVLELLADLRVVPVEVRLLGREQVQVPLAGRAVRVGGAGPGRAAEDGLPVVRRQLAVRAPAGAEPEQVARGRAGAAVKRLDEPRVRVGAVVGHHVDDDADAERVRLADQLLGLGQRAEDRVDGAVVGHVVAGVGLRRGVPRVEPHRVDAEVGQVVAGGRGRRRGRRCRRRCCRRSCADRSGR